jgi:hypothetical protein
MGHPADETVESEGSMTVNCVSSTDEGFLNTLKLWLHDQSEILIMIRYSRAGGDKDFEFFTSFAMLSEWLLHLPPSTSVTAYGRPQLRLRGVVDDDFINKCLAAVPDGKEFLLVETVRQTAGRYSWFHNAMGETHDELRASLDNSRGKPVAVGLFPPWPDESADVVMAFVPDENGVVQPGVY